MPLPSWCWSAAPSVWGTPESVHICSGGNGWPGEESRSLSVPGLLQVWLEPTGTQVKQGECDPLSYPLPRGELGGRLLETSSNEGFFRPEHLLSIQSPCFLLWNPAVHVPELNKDLRQRTYLPPCHSAVLWGSGSLVIQAPLTKRAPPLLLLLNH